MFGSWPDRRHDLDFYNLFQNPDKFDECDPDLMLTTPCSEYYSVRNFNTMLVNSDAKSFSILHCNIRSLPKNLNLLEEILCSLDSKVDILGITETKLGEKSISNVNIKGYNFYHTDSPTNAGGAALYITSNLNAIPRPGIKFNMNLVESCWAEIDAGKGKRKIIVGCIYKHPACNLEQFRNQVNNVIKTLNPNRHEISDCKVLDEKDCFRQEQFYVQLIVQDGGWSSAVALQRVWFFMALLRSYSHRISSPR